MNSEEYVPFAEIVAELKNVCAAGKTGVMYITSVENRSAQLMLDQGKIVFLYFFNKRGRDALRLMGEIETGRFRFQEGTSPTLRTELPHTEDILRFLSAASGLLPNDSAGSGNSESGQVKENTTSTAIMTLTVDQKQALEEGLAGYIGPMASIICEDHFDSVHDMQTAIDRLAAEIPVSAQADAFREKMLERFSF